jgi:hypothetical protein
MEHTARIFNCARCHRQVVICSCCDRGNIYCSQTCSTASRQESIRAAGVRYQKTYTGKLKHAERQRRYRCKKVTHHSYQMLPTNDLLRFDIDEAIKIVRKDELHCHFCGCSCNQLLRTSFLGRERTLTPGFWLLGP